MATEQLAEGGAEQPPLSDSLTASIMGVLGPVVGQIDDHVKATQASQNRLRDHILELESELSHYRESNAVPVELSPYLAKLVDARKKVQRANGILKSVQGRLDRVGAAVAKSTATLKAQTETATPAAQQ